MKRWIHILSVVLNLVLVGVLVFLNERYGLWAKVQRVGLVEGSFRKIEINCLIYELQKNCQLLWECPVNLACIYKK